jgi:hypothetical protein
VTLKDFVPLCEIGTGAYGRVTLVKRHNNHLYAMKEIPKVPCRAPCAAPP